MAIKFDAPEAWRGPGAPRIAIPQEIADALEETYRTGKVAYDEADQTDEETWKAIRLMRLHCSRQGKKLASQFFERDGKTWLRFRMVDKRPYAPKTTTSLPRERR